MLKRFPKTPCYTIRMAVDVQEMSDTQTSSAALSKTLIYFIHLSVQSVAVGGFARI